MHLNENIATELLQNPTADFRAQNVQSLFGGWKEICWTVVSNDCIGFLCDQVSVNS